MSKHGNTVIYMGYGPHRRLPYFSLFLVLYVWGIMLEHAPVLRDRIFSPAPLLEEDIEQFQQIVYAFYAQHKRVFPWRETEDPYKILVSEMMLQQTQTDRVVSKYTVFIDRFPTVAALADASLDEVLRLWHGLGYNRRARFLKQAAEAIMLHHQGRVPDDAMQLRSLPGVGPYSAAAVQAFAFNKPVILIETNIRTVFLHFFFRGKSGVTDRQLVPLVEQTLDSSSPRDWYYALMDYGVMLKKKVTNPSRRSAHYTKQEPFQGSNRQLRGQILKKLLDSPGKSIDELARDLQISTDKLMQLLGKLADEKMIKQQKQLWYIA